MRLKSCWMAVALAAVVGCGGSGSGTMVPVKGYVKVNKQPAAGALIVFHPLDAGKQNAAKPVAVVAEDGTFVLTTTAQNDGAPVGEYGITVVWNAKGKESNLPSLGDGGGAAADRLFGRYGNPKEPKLKQSIKKGEVYDLKFDLE